MDKDTFGGISDFNRLIRLCGAIWSRGRYRSYPCHYDYIIQPPPSFEVIWNALFYPPIAKVVVVIWFWWWMLCYHWNTGNSPLTDLIYTRVSHITQNFFHVWDFTCFEMVIYDNEHMSNHPAIFWPVLAKAANSVKNSQKWKLELKPLKTKNKCPK